jgi:hypothetical protein
MDRFVCTLPVALLSRLSGVAQTDKVWLSAERHGHILDRRKRSTTIDVDVSANRMGEALLAAEYVSPVNDDSPFVEVVGYVSSQGRYCHVVLKFLPAERSKSGNPECWIQTSRSFGTNDLKRHIASRELIPLDESEGP